MNILHKFNIYIKRIFPRPFERWAVKGNNLIGVEIGVYKGEHALSMLKNLDIKRLYLIDPFTLYSESKHYNGIEQDTLEKAKEILIKRFEDNKRVLFIFERSEDCFDDIPNDLDFVYIDGAHDYINVKRDIDNYYPKVKEGGILGGHDFFNGDCSIHNGVIEAVIEFVYKNKLKLYVDYPDWWVVKELEVKK